MRSDFMLMETARESLQCGQGVEEPLVLYHFLLFSPIVGSSFWTRSSCILSLESPLTRWQWQARIRGDVEHHFLALIWSQVPDQPSLYIDLLSSLMNPLPFNPGGMPPTWQALLNRSWQTVYTSPKQHQPSAFHHAPVPVCLVVLFVGWFVSLHQAMEVKLYWGHRALRLGQEAGLQAN